MDNDIYLAGVGGIPNYGDEFINKTWLDYLSERRPEQRVVSCTNRPSNVATFQRDVHPRLQTSSLLADLVGRSAKRASRFEDRAAWISNKLRRRATPEWDLGISNLVSDCESLHFMGGGYLNSDWPSRYLFLEMAVTIKELTGAKIFGTGLGLVPFSEPLRPWIEEALSTFDVAEARDQPSSSIAGVQLGIDDAWLAFRNGLDSVKRMDSPPAFVINIQKDYSGPYLEKMLEISIDAVKNDPRYSTAATIGVAEAFPSKDGWMFNRLKKELPNPIEFLTFQKLWEEGLPAGEDTSWITTRFHFHLLASALGSKGIVLSGGGEFYDVKHRSLLDAGTGWKFVNVADHSDGGSLRVERSCNFDSVVTELAKEKLALADSMYPLTVASNKRTAVVSSVSRAQHTRLGPFLGVVTHKDCAVPSDPSYAAVIVGPNRRDVNIDGSSSIFFDDAGENISHKNAGYCELTAMYWMWQNVSASIKGLVHYRRFLKGVGSEQVISGNEAELLLRDYDVLLPNQWLVTGRGLAAIPKTVANQYGRAHSPGDLLDILDIIHNDNPDYVDAFFRVMRSDRFYLGNIAIMRESLFDSYCEWLFGILFKFEESHPISAYGSTYQRRVYGFLSERLFSVWLERNSDLRRLSLNRLRV